jgi:hypothetical protein
MRGGAAETGPFAFLSRRVWLRAALTGGVLLTGGGVGLLALRGRAPSIRGLEVLSAHEHRTLVALACTHLHLPNGFPNPESGRDLLRRIDAFVAHEPAEVVAELKRALVFFEFGPVLFRRHMRTFSNLSPGDQLAEWRAWNTSHLLLQRQAAFAFRKMLGMFYFDTPDAWPHIGYAGPSFWGKAG